MMYASEMFSRSLPHFFRVILILTVPAGIWGQEDTDLPLKAFVAEVGSGRVDFSQVFEIWQQPFRELKNRHSRGDLDLQSFREQLQQSWTEALTTAIREEVFYQEAGRDMNNLIRNMAKQRHEQLSAYAGRSDYVPPLPAVEQDIWNRYHSAVENLIQERVEVHIARAGGAEKMHQVLARQDLTWELWRQRIRRRTIIDWYLHHRFPQGGKTEPRPSEIRAFYRDNPEKFQTPGKMRLRHIFVDSLIYDREEDARNKAADIYRLLQEEDADFAEIASKYSDDKVSASYGGLEPLPEENDSRGLESRRLAWLEDVREAALELPLGNILNPVMISPMGLHLVMVEKRAPPTPIPFTEVQQQITEIIRAAEWEAEVQQLYEQLKIGINIAILQEQFPERYINR